MLQVLGPEVTAQRQLLFTRLLELRLLLVVLLQLLLLLLQLHQCWDVRNWIIRSKATEDTEEFYNKKS